MFRSATLFVAALVSSPIPAAIAQVEEPIGAKVAARPSTGHDWETLPTDPYPGKRDDVVFADAAHGWYGTGKGDLYATSDGGASWAKVASRPGTFIRALGFVDARTGFIGNVGTGYYPGVTDTTPLYRTDDGGKSWTAVNLGDATIAGICSIDILHTRRIFQGKLEPATVITAAGRVGGPAALARSVNGGTTWKVTDMSRWTGMILDVHFVDERTGFVAGSSSSDVNTANAQILMTNDGGATWSEVYRSTRQTELIWKMSWPTAEVGYGTVMSYDQENAHKLVIKTVDGGRHWQELPLVENGKAVELGIGFVDARHGWVGTTVGGFETRDGGQNFAPAPIAPAANKFRVVPQAAGNPFVYAIGTKVQRLKISD
jgi:photosystem II stability/assembly factor-like uncharacterized protein